MSISGEHPIDPTTSAEIIRAAMAEEVIEAWGNGIDLGDICSGGVVSDRLRTLTSMPPGAVNDARMAASLRYIDINIQRLIDQGHSEEEAQKILTERVFLGFIKDHLDKEK
jgi:hypothetical protein